jgi:predicted DNA-binding transcriptional regulator YafY
MPKSPIHFSVSRQLEMLRSIPTHGRGITAKQLTENLLQSGFKVGKRTVERDLIDLSLRFGLFRDTSSMPHHWKILKPLDIASVEITEAVSLVLAEEVLRKMMPASMLQTLEPKFTQARGKLEALPHNTHARWTRKVRYIPASLAHIPPKISTAVLSRIQTALLEEKQIVLRYSAHSSKKATEITLHPLSLVQRGTVPYLVATAYDYEDPRLYAIHRVQSAKVIDEPCRTPKGYSVDQYIASGALDFGSGEKLQLKARIHNDLAIYLMETPIAEDQEIALKNGAYQLTATVRNTWQLHFWILSQGSSITVLSPRSLRDQIRNEAVATARNYEEESKPAHKRKSTQS